jgi:hypothetical protein
MNKGHSLKGKLYNGYKFEEKIGEGSFGFSISNILLIALDWLDALPFNPLCT